jgi:RNA polymerase sigma-70 factor (ECF subfamily)
MAAIWSASRGARWRAPVLLAPGVQRISTIGHAILQPAREVVGQSRARADGAFDHPRSAVVFDRLFEQHEPQIFGYLYRMTGDRQLASDLCQETFLRAWQHCDQLAAYRDPLGWLFRVATNLALNARRDRLRLRRIASPRADAGEEGSVGVDPTSTVAESQLIHDILQGLAPRARAALVLREVYGLSLDEIAALLEISAAATKKMLSRARAQFRQQYRREEASP